MDQRSIVVVESSPRKAGNSSLLARCLIEGAGSAGARVEEFALRGLKVGPCIACDSCRRPGARGCVVPDDMQAIYAAIRAADAVVLASPVYWFSVNAQLKALAKISRMLKDPGFRSDLMAAENAEEIYRKIAEKDESY